MFQRLNASSSLNAAERRNAVSGATRDAANSLAGHELLTQSSPIKNARYKYRELGAKVLAIEHQRDTKGRIVDTKANTLYNLFVATHGTSPSIAAETMERYRDQATATLGRMFAVFSETDPLLSSIGTVVVYYVVFRDVNADVTLDRDKLQTFEELRRQASRMADDDPNYARAANARLREYNVLVQSTNDGGAIERRAAILLAFLEHYKSVDSLVGLDTLSEGEIPEEEGSEE